MERFDYSLLADPKVYQIDRLAAHSSHVFYKNKKEAEQKKSSFIKNLNGIWKFHYTPNLDLIPTGFEKEEVNCDSWDDIRVPGSIQLQGYGAPQYVNVISYLNGAASSVTGAPSLNVNTTFETSVAASERVPALDAETRVTVLVGSC